MARVAFAAVASALLLLLLLEVALMVVMAVEAWVREAPLLPLRPLVKSTAVAPAPRACALCSLCSLLQASTTPLKRTSLAPSALRRKANSESPLRAARKDRLDFPSAAIPTSASTAARPRSGNAVESAVTGTGMNQSMVLTGRA